MNYKVYVDQKLKKSIYEDPCHVKQKLILLNLKV